MDGSGYYPYFNSYSQQDTLASTNNANNNSSQNQGYGGGFNNNASQYSVEPTPFPAPGQGTVPSSAPTSSMYNTTTTNATSSAPYGSTPAAPTSNYDNYSSNPSTMNASYSNNTQMYNNVNTYPPSSLAPGYSNTNYTQPMDNASGSNDNSLSNDLMGFLAGAAGTSSSSQMNNSYNNAYAATNNSQNQPMNNAGEGGSGGGAGTAGGVGTSGGTQGIGGDQYATFMQDAFNLFAPSPIEIGGSNVSSNPPAPVSTMGYQPTSVPNPMGAGNAQYYLGSANGYSAPSPMGDNNTSYGGYTAPALSGGTSAANAYEQLSMNYSNAATGAVANNAYGNYGQSANYSTPAFGNNTVQPTPSSGYPSNAPAMNNWGSATAAYSASVPLATNAAVNMNQSFNAPTYRGPTPATVGAKVVTANNAGHSGSGGAPAAAPKVKKPRKPRKPKKPTGTNIPNAPNATAGQPNAASSLAVTNYVAPGDRGASGNTSVQSSIGQGQEPYSQRALIGAPAGFPVPKAKQAKGRSIPPIVSVGVNKTSGSAGKGNVSTNKRLSKNATLRPATGTVANKKMPTTPLNSMTGGTNNVSASASTPPRNNAISPSKPKPPPRKPINKPIGCTISNLRKLLTKSRTEKRVRQTTHSSKPAVAPPRHIEIPSEFAPSFSYRATAAYSLLRTLGVELRLSPFSLQSFLNSLALPIPSRLLGEIHVRVIRVLYANIGMGSYSKFGEGPVPNIKRKKKLIGEAGTGEASGEVDPDKPTVEEILVTKRGGDNLFFLDNATWPLFFEDYAIATEEKFLEDTDEEESFIDLRSAAMLPMEELELHPRAPPPRFLSRNSMNTVHSRSRIAGSGRPSPTEGWFCRCPAGPMGRRNSVGRFVCCPFHIVTAVKMALQKQPLPPTSISKPSTPGVATSKGASRSSSKKRGRPTYKKTTPAKRKSTRKSQTKKAYLEESSSSGSDDSEDCSDEEFPSPIKNIRSGSAVKSNAQAHFTTAVGRGSRVLDIEVATPYKFQQPMVGSPKKVVTEDAKTPLSKVQLQISAQSTFQASGKHEPNSQSILPSKGGTGMTSSAIFTPMQSVPSRKENGPPRPFQPIFVPPIPPPPVEENSLLVADDVGNVLERYFREGDLFVAQKDAGLGTKKVEHAVENNSSSSPRTACQLVMPKKDIDEVHAVMETIIENIENREKAFSDNKGESGSARDNDIQHQESARYDTSLTHFDPIKQLRRGIPYHHLSLEDKLKMLEFLLDELLSVGDISNELGTRQLATEPFSSLYGKPPLSHEFDDMYNADECNICGMEGDLLCCDGCPGSFHRVCLNMGNGRLPEGKWLCQECRLTDASKMGPLGSDRRPLLGWFTIDDVEVCNIVESEPQGTLVAATSSGITTVMPRENHSFNALPHSTQIVPPATHAGYTDASLQTPIAVNEVKDPKIETQSYEGLRPELNALARVEPDTNPRLSIQKDDSEFTCQIPKLVEFLVASGNVFARYRSSHKPFDPFEPLVFSMPPSSPSLTLKYPSPPTPLNTSQLLELLKLLGPKLCFSLPWRHIKFNPRKIWPSSSRDEAHDFLQSLVAYQTEERELFLGNSELYNPVLYINNYRRAPPIPILKAHLGQFSCPAILHDINNYPTKVSALSISSLDPTSELGPQVRIPYCDPVQSIRDKMIKLEKSLCDACLLDTGWGTRQYGMDEDGWKKKIYEANSIRILATLLIKLVDASCSRAFYKQWHELKDNGNTEEVLRLSPGSSNQEFTLISSEWSPEKEKVRRKWERCTISDIIRLLGSEEGLLEKIFGDGMLSKKRGKRRNIVSSTTPTNQLQGLSNEEPDEQIKNYDKNSSSQNLSPADAKDVKWNTLDKTSPLVSAVESTKSNVSPTSSQSQARAKDSVKDEFSLPDTSNNGVAEKSSCYEVVSSNKSEDGVSAKESVSNDLNPSEPSQRRNETPTTLASQIEPTNKRNNSVDAKTESTNMDYVSVEANVTFTETNSPAKECTISSDAPDKYVEKDKKTKRCGKCDVCIEADCSECFHCIDMKKNVGPNKLHQSCLKRKPCPIMEAQELQDLDREANSNEPTTPAATDASKRRRVSRGVMSASSSRRRSDRLNVVRYQLESLLGIDEADTTSKIEIAINELKIDKLEKALAADPTEAYWSIAGKKLFKPTGTLPHSAVKRLARNAGSARAPSVAYETSYEVGETTVCHHWRKKTLESTTFEDLALSFRFLDAHIDKGVRRVLMSCYVFSHLNSPCLTLSSLQSPLSRSPCLAAHSLVRRPRKRHLLQLQSAASTLIHQRD